MTSNRNPIVVAFDGTAASGKSSVAKLVAKECGYDYLDTGLMFRKIAYYCIKQNIDLNNEKEISKVIKTFNFDKDVDKSNIYLDAISNVASQIAVKRSVREALLKMQRKFADGKKGVIIDGRDIGTVVFPNADFKFFFNASLEERATRRYNQLRKIGEVITFSQVLDSLRMRDQRDKDRCVAPLKKAEDSFEIDTTSLSINEALDIILKKIEND